MWVVLTQQQMTIDEDMDPASDEEDSAAVPAAAAINPPRFGSQTPSAPRKRRYQKSPSAVEGTLAEVAVGGEDGVGEMLGDVVERLQGNGHIYLTEAATVLQKKHTGRALDKILSELPVMAISHSRKEGWIIIPKDEDEQYDAMMLLIKRVEELQHDIDSRSAPRPSTPCALPRRSALSGFATTSSTRRTWSCSSR